MSETRVPMPNGMLFRTRSSRRFVVACYIGGMQKWVADYRTDVESRAVARWRENVRRSYETVVVDTYTGGIIR